MIEEIDAKDAAERIAARPEAVLLDVREDEELQIVSVDGARHIPMGDIPSRISELDPDTEIYCLCHHGMRSAQVAGYLAQQGFEKVLNVRGGIDAWATFVDESLPRY
jgi:rhodanese-related sulfurtransferase